MPFHRLMRRAACANVLWASLALAGTVAAATPVVTVPGMPPVSNPANLYSQSAANDFSPAVKGALQRVYVPNVRSKDVYVIDPAT